jgi:hypothetical protein
MRRELWADTLVVVVVDDGVAVVAICPRSHATYLSGVRVCEQNSER